MTALTSMTALSVSSPLSCLEPITLDELNSAAALQTRVDRKYVLRASEVDDILDALRSHVQVLEIGDLRQFAYESVYFDTPDLVTYFLAAQKRRRRFKVRTRTYLDSSLCWLEVKTRGPRGSTVKNRLPYKPEDRALLEPGRWFVDSVLAKESIAGWEEMTFAPTLVTHYRRTTLYLPETNSRVTIDTDLGWEDDGCHRLRVPSMAIIETKTGSTASCVDRLLWSRGHRPGKISKYATALAALWPDLPSSKWTRTLHRHFVASSSPLTSGSPSWLLGRTERCDAKHCRNSLR